MTPNKRINRVMRWLEKCGDIPDCAVVHNGPWTTVYANRVDAANNLFAREIEFVSKLAEQAIVIGAKP